MRPELGLSPRYPHRGLDRTKIEIFIGLTRSIPAARRSLPISHFPDDEPNAA